LEIYLNQCVIKDSAEEPKIKEDGFPLFVGNRADGIFSHFFHDQFRGRVPLDCHGLNGADRDATGAAHAFSLIN
jgi:hypothetical protein